MDNRKTKLSVFWRILQQYSAYIIKMIVQIVLARILMPDDFGVIAIVMVFISIGEIIAISGFGVALIQKNNPEPADFATLLTCSILFSVVVYIILFFSAPFIATYYENDSLVLILRVQGVSVFIQSYAAIQNAIVAKRFEFKKSFIATLIATALSGAISIILAYKGFGIWCLVLQNALAPFLTIIFIHILVPWTPRIGFEKKRFIELFSFSWKVLLSSLIGTLLEDSYNLVIGKRYGDEKLGFYKQGNSYPNAILGQTRTAINAVMLPIYSSLKDDSLSLRNAIKKMTHLSTVIIFPMAFGLAAISKPFVIIVLTEKWLPCIFFLRLECIFYALLPLSSSLNTGINAIGRSDIPLKIELGKLIVTVTAIIVLHSFGIEVLCVSRIIIAVSTIFVSVFIARRFVKYSFKDLLFDTYKPFLFSMIMGIIVYLISYLSLSNYIILATQILVGVLIYGLLLILFMKDDIIEIINLVKGKGKNSD